MDEADSCFGVNYDKIDKESKNSYFINIYSNLHTAMYILPFTSYANVENKDENSANAISRLYLTMTVTNKSNSSWKAVTQKRQAIFKYLHYISTNPNDKKSQLSYCLYL
ncbi:hypothetical protein [Clostridium akagii]|uniref:hypothetical protein n=1 Tax=Clostridium akagii TaxID=91623 RepID=UPI00047B777D|nr:hypothetical protein [Clostridium akagii]